MNKKDFMPIVAFFAGTLLTYIMCAFIAILATGLLPWEWVEDVRIGVTIFSTIVGFLSLVVYADSSV